MKLNAQAILVALALAGCTPSTPTTEAPDQPGPVAEVPPPPDPVPQDDTAGASGMDTATWFTDVPPQSGVRRLMYSARHSDEMGINLQCRTPGTVTATIVRIATELRPQTYPFTLKGGAETLDVAGKVVRSDSEYLFIEAEIPAGAPVLAAMAQSGKASLTDAGHTTEMNAINEGERKAIVDFLAACPA